MTKSAQKTLPGEETMKKNNLKTIITANKIWKSFKTGDRFTTVLKEIDVDIQEGNLVMLFGPSGCGKSTLLNTLMGLEHPDKGDVKFMGFDIWNLNSDDRAVIRKKNVGIVYQQQNWIKSLNVVDNVAIVGKLIGLDKEKSRGLAMEKLEIVGMTHRAEYKPYELSSGEQQRISLARSLMSDPALIIADEPTGNLDVKSGIKVMQIFRDLADQGKTILMVTHNPESLEFADRILFMIDGKIRKDMCVKNEKIDDVKKQINNDLEAFISGVETTDEVEADAKVVGAPEPTIYEEEKASRRERWLRSVNFARFNLYFTCVMFLMTFVYAPIRIFERIFRIKDFRYSTAFEKNLGKFFLKFDGAGGKGIERSISDWELGEISASHLIEKKSRSMITVLGVGIGIGFITFLLSLGYGLESLVVHEIAEIEEMKQVEVTPLISSEVVLDDEKLEIISSINGIKDVYPLTNIATTLYYQDSQTDVVAYGAVPGYFEVSRDSMLYGEPCSEEEEGKLVISEEVASMLALEGNSSIDKEVSLDFIPVGTTFDEEASYESVKYQVSGVISGVDTPVIYVPLEDLKEIGVSEYSQLLVVLEDNADMTSVRQDIEALGMKTTTIMDTISQVEEFFSYFRLALAVVGTVAFFIAILGMINTLTVSLLERTREVGLLKSIGMKSQEIRKLFVTESMIIAFSGGVIGVFLGWLLGALLSGIISMMSISQGGEYMSISKVPLYLGLGIVFISVLIGFITGLYPSKRAVKMSPLDALRYE